VELRRAKIPDVIRWPIGTPRYRRALRRLFARRVTISIPTVKDNTEALSILHNLRLLINEPRMDVAFDFVECRELSQQAIAFLGGLARAIQRSRGIVRFKWDTCRPRVIRMFRASGFTVSFKGPPAHPGPHVVPYREYLSADPNAVLDYLTNSWLSPEWISLTPGFRQALISVVLEIYLNAFEHADSPIGVLTCGLHDETKEIVRLVVMDFGVGIPHRVRAFTKRPSLRASTTMKWAFASGTTTSPKPDTARGVGLDLLRQFVRLNKGYLRVYSHEGFAEVKSKSERFMNRGIPFHGTLVDIMFRCDRFHYGFASELDEVPEPNF
jgi:signal transduction histidine kinase